MGQPLTNTVQPTCVHTSHSPGCSQYRPALALSSCACVQPACSFIIRRAARLGRPQCRLVPTVSVCACLQPACSFIIRRAARPGRPQCRLVPTVSVCACLQPLPVQSLAPSTVPAACRWRLRFSALHPPLQRTPAPHPLSGTAGLSGGSLHFDLSFSRARAGLYGPARASAQPVQSPAGHRARRTSSAKRDFGA